MFEEKGIIVVFERKLILIVCIYLFVWRVSSVGFLLLSFCGSRGRGRSS